MPKPAVSVAEPVSHGKRVAEAAQDSLWQM